MIKAEKEIRFIIDGEDAQTLTDACEFIRVVLLPHRCGYQDFSNHPIREISAFIHKVFNCM